MKDFEARRIKNANFANIVLYSGLREALSFGDSNMRVVTSVISLFPTSGCQISCVSGICGPSLTVTWKIRQLHLSTEEAQLLILN